ncbi:MAG TPA: hypothetical protein VKU85_16930 [bacterium]|nr:hypothetical protein [bacterium]
MHAHRIAAVVLLLSVASSARGSEPSEPDSVASTSSFLLASSSGLLQAVEAFGDVAAEIESEEGCGIFHSFAMVHRLEARGWMLRCLLLADAEFRMIDEIGLRSPTAQMLRTLAADLPEERRRALQSLEGDERLLSTYLKGLEEGEDALRSTGTACLTVVRRIRENWPFPEE